MDISNHATRCITCRKELEGKQTKYCSVKCKQTYQPNIHYTYQKARATERKLALIAQKGGKCEQCGYSRCVKALEFHHINPDDKEMKLDARSLAGHNWEALQKEASKCLLLCANCHRELHDDNIKFAA
jgi:5-methylcytosine-specific restriction endonuclease McrA